MNSFSGFRSDGAAEDLAAAGGPCRKGKLGFQFWTRSFSSSSLQLFVAFCGQRLGLGKHFVHFAEPLPRRWASSDFRSWILFFSPPFPLKRGKKLRNCVLLNSKRIGIALFLFCVETGNSKGRAAQFQVYVHPQSCMRRSCCFSVFVSSWSREQGPLEMIPVHPKVCFLFFLFLFQIRNGAEVDDAATEEAAAGGAGALACWRSVQRRHYCKLIMQKGEVKKAFKMIIINSSLDPHSFVFN